MNPLGRRRGRGSLVRSGFFRRMDDHQHADQGGVVVQRAESGGPLIELPCLIHRGDLAVIELAGERFGRWTQGRSRFDSIRRTPRSMVVGPYAEKLFRGAADPSRERSIPVCDPPLGIEQINRLGAAIEQAKERS